MDKKFLIGFAVILLLVGILVFSGGEKNKEVVKEEQPKEEVASDKIIEATFLNDETGDQIDVVFNNETEVSTAVLNGLGLNNLVFEIATSASGARYLNEEQGLELWNKGNKITLSEGDRIIFEGETAGTKEVLDETGLSDFVWIWEGTKKATDSESFTPKKVGDFSLTFSKNDGLVFGKTDCNNFSGQYTVTGNDISFGPLAMTQMYCEGSEETDFSSAVASSTSFSFDKDGNLQLLLEAGAGTVTFSKE